MEPLTAQMSDATLVGIYVVLAVGLFLILRFDPYKDHIK